MIFFSDLLTKNKNRFIVNSPKARMNNKSLFKLLNFYVYSVTCYEFITKNKFKKSHWLYSVHFINIKYNHCKIKQYTLT